MHHTPSNKNIIARLTALWALSESGLGGVMHAMKIPLTGIFVGGFAVIIIILIMHYAGRNFSTVLKSTLLVILVKAAVSPQSPFPAYIAVTFQGLIGVFLFALIKNFRLASLLFGALALAESALQKFLITTIWLGKSIWEALDTAIGSLARDFHLTGEFSFSFWLISIYTFVHLTWGMLLGYWASGLPSKIENSASQILKAYKSGKNNNTIEAVIENKKNRRWLLFIAVLLFFITILYLEGSMNKILYVIVRTIAILLLTYMVIVPLVKWVLLKLESKNKQNVALIINELPGLKNLVRPSYQMASLNSGGIKKYKAFVLILIVLSIYEKENES